MAITLSTKEVLSFSLSDKATVDLLFSFLPTFDTVVVSPSLSLNEAIPGPVLANRYALVQIVGGGGGGEGQGARGLIFLQKTGGFYVAT